MSAQKNKPTLAAKAVQMVYEFPGDLKRGWEAERTGESAYLLRRPDGTTREINLYEPLRTAKGDLLPSRNDALGLLTVGDWSVLIGKNINHGLHARKLGADDTYLLMDEKTTTNLGTFKIGDQHKGRPVAKIDTHLLQIGDEVVAIKPKKHDITLLVMATEENGGNVAYINMTELGNKQNRKDGARGTFIRPKKEGEPALFYEEYSRQRVLTAQFWLEKNEKKATFYFRDAHTAFQSGELNKKLEDARLQALNVGIEPEDYDVYVKLNKQVVALAEGWKKDGMRVITGVDFFRPKSLHNEPPTPS
jgi:hypothetical protein